MADFTANFTLSEIEAIDATFVINQTPTKTSQLTNDSDFVSDTDYVHTDNNFTDILLTNLNNQSGVNTGDETNSTIIQKIGYTPANNANTPIITSGSGVPTSTPTKIGDVYVDTAISTHPVYYTAVGNTSSANWIKQNGSYVITCSTSSTVPTPSKNTSYFFGALMGADTALSAIGLNKRIYIPKNGLLKCCQGTIVSSGNGSNEATNLYIRINDTTDILVKENILFNQAKTFFINNNLNTLVSTNDFVYFKLVTPNWTTVPNYLSAFGTILVET